MPYYAVAKGREPGIYTDWASTESRVRGYAGATFKKFNTASEAQQFISNYRSSGGSSSGGGGSRSSDTAPSYTAPSYTAPSYARPPVRAALSRAAASRRSNAPYRRIGGGRASYDQSRQNSGGDSYGGSVAAAPLPQRPSHVFSGMGQPQPTYPGLPAHCNDLKPHNVLYVDGACNPATRASDGVSAWASVVDGAGRDVVCASDARGGDMDIQPQNLPVGKRNVIVTKASHVKTQNNNGAELAAMAYALRYANSKPGEVKVIASDSSLVLDYWSKGRVSKQTRERMDPAVKDLITEVDGLRQQFERNGGILVKVPGSSNPADLGWH
ncbi:hypothetical protein CXG81DRAFT_18244 [Caulochytrium protostelioides]|uniref:ribonuclease H n=1 Tax=Caulochytrium protostelioides TaxID=1555241 RepID=A0A4P9X9U0_9FUNG|nr:hypothetical protein CXG81DRAFT_18244 [Caulochytrium protostelioides]|eukprot:RKP02072.1 hypothetical protein CXG81DRAFT_18244 [Caulochytrium protostelioides]